jgi:hypothetical protein
MMPGPEQTHLFFKNIGLSYSPSAGLTWGRVVGEHKIRQRGAQPQLWTGAAGLLRLDGLPSPLKDHMAHLTEPITVLLEKKRGKEKPLSAGGEEPAPSRPQSPPEVMSPAERPPAIMVGPPWWGWFNQNIGLR